MFPGNLPRSKGIRLSSLPAYWIPVLGSFVFYGQLSISIRPARGDAYVESGGHFTVRMNGIIKRIM